MVNVSIHQAKTQLSKLLRLVEEGESVVIENRGRPVARLIRYHANEQTRDRVWGRDAGAVVIHTDFDAPLPDSLGAAFGL